MRHYISLGAGVQSSTMALMFACGELTPMPDAAIFADTQWERRKGSVLDPASGASIEGGTYGWIEWMRSSLPFPIELTTKGDLLAASLRERRNKKTGNPYMKHLLPTYTLNQVGDTAAVKDGKTPKKCSEDFKIIPLTQTQRRLARVPRGSKSKLVRVYMGISWDESHRMRDPWEPWIENVYPLVDRRMTRADCSRWMKDRGYPPPPRSSCIFCPLHSNEEWRMLKEESPVEFMQAVVMERNLNMVAKKQGLTHMGEFLHPSRKPLDQVDFRSDVDRGQGLLFGDDCTGMCGV